MRLLSSHIWSSPLGVPKATSADSLVGRPCSSVRRSLILLQQHRGYAKTPGRRVKRFVPDDAAGFVKPNGVFFTTREHVAFLSRHSIEMDNGCMAPFGGGHELSRLCSRATATLAYSPRHVINPYDLRFFGPRGHPLAPMKREQYAVKAQREPLWVFVTSAGGASAVVRRTAQGRLMRSIHRALRDLGYHASSSATARAAQTGLVAVESTGIRGTLWITIYNSVRAADQCFDEFGRSIAEALAAHCKTQ
ncbi:hypothetical protein AAL_01449 [Moelleriella libera RCEF 2490]|uniref:Uncharacterized protein n=1 Tax=Moelleriella libera RCEF 2490 TaxID=1081109 RepID=A0A166U6E3_9HYPO|nr:hypothetical protein AAL_01449 [Moelleriella libera RCEF 2490]